MDALHDRLSIIYETRTVKGLKNERYGRPYQAQKGPFTVVVAYGNFIF